MIGLVTDAEVFDTCVDGDGVDVDEGDCDCDCDGVNEEEFSTQIVVRNFGT